MPISQGKLTLASTGLTRLAGPVASKSVALKAPRTNEAAVELCGKETPAGKGFPLEPGDTVDWDGSGLDDLWVRGTVGDSLHWLAAA